jgi:DNA topoisomerase IB
MLDDKHLARIIRRTQQLPGQQLFQYIDDEGKRQPIDSGMVNEYLREVMDAEGVGFTAKDFRTWGATVRAIAHLACQKCEGEISKTAFNKCVVACAREVSEALGNTPAVCRKSYINPLVFDAWRKGVIAKLVPVASTNPRRMERIALKILKAR